MPRFSVITPVHLWSQDRVAKFIVCAESVRQQTFQDFEWIIVDDGSTEEFLWSSVQDAAPKVTIIHQPHYERVIAYNKAFAEAKGEWFCLLDSDDEYKPKTLQRINFRIKESPNSKMFNFGAIYANKDGKFTFRDPFKVKRKGKGHEQFGPGNIVNGTFVFSRELYDELGGYPGGTEGYIENMDCTELHYGGKRQLFMGSPWDFSAMAQLIFPEIRKYFFIDKVSEPEKVIRELGNPWGNDYFLYYKYTRKYHSKAVREHLYIVHPR